MKKILSLFQSETTYFSQHISGNVRRIVISNICKTLAGPLVSTFLNAFVWRATGSLLAVALYNAGLYLGLPIAFYFNGLLLRKCNIRKLFAVGSVLSGISSLLVIALTSLGNNLGMVLLFGFLFGIGTGFYWSNRNYLEFQETLTDMRQYYFGILSSVGALASIIVPLIAGWFIVLGSYLGLYTSAHAYWILFGVSFFLMLIAGYVVYEGKFESPVPLSISRLSLGSFWMKRRLLSVAAGFTDGLIFLPTLLVLKTLGNEGVLGTLTAAISLLSIFAFYIYGRTIKVEYQKKAIAFSSTLFLLAPLGLVLLSPRIGVMFFAALTGIAVSFFSISASSVFLSLSEQEMAGDATKRYSFIFDNELFLNTGRIIGIVAILILAHRVSESSALLYGPLIIAIFHILFLMPFFIKKE
jgi:YQGE family putative transporter